MAGEGELNRVIKDLQSKCANQCPASMLLHGTSYPGCARSLLAPKSWAVGSVTASDSPENPCANPATAACSHPHCQPLGTSSAQEVAMLLAPPAPLLHPEFLFLSEVKEARWGILLLSTTI